MIDLTKLNENQKNTLDKFASGEIVSKEALGDYLYEKLMEINGNILTIESLEELCEYEGSDEDNLCNLSDEQLKELFGDDYKDDVNIMEVINDGRS